MKIWMEAQVEWIPVEKGGRQNKLPDNTRYCPIIIFPDSKTDEAWSAEILTNSINDDNEATISISFLVSDAPFSLLEPNARFELYEGKRCVATGVLTREFRQAEVESWDRE